jgi:hypothetical protein
MATQKHMGANSLVARLAAQVGSREMAVKILRQRGHMEMDSERLTPAGQARDGMTAKERALTGLLRAVSTPPARTSTTPRRIRPR